MGIRCRLAGVAIISALLLSAGPAAATSISLGSGSQSQGTTLKLDLAASLSSILQSVSAQASAQIDLQSLQSRDLSALLDFAKIKLEEVRGLSRVDTRPPPAGVPEPTAALLFAAGTLVVTRRRLLR